MVWRNRVLFWIAAVGTLLADLFSKRWAFAWLDAQPDNRVVLTSWLWLTEHVNKGVVFSWLSGEKYIIIALTSVLVPAIVMMAYSCRAPRAPLWALGLLLGGAVGNLYDRLFVQHALLGNGVRDFLDLRNPATGQNLWPVFNGADMAIVIGVVIYVGWSLLFAPPETADAPPADTENNPTEKADATQEESA